MKKALISLLVVVLLSGCLFGCGREAVSEDPAPVPTVETTATPVPVSVLRFPDGSAHQADETRLISRGLRTRTFRKPRSS